MRHESNSSVWKKSDLLNWIIELIHAYLCVIVSELLSSFALICVLMSLYICNMFVYLCISKYYWLCVPGMYLLNIFVDVYTSV